MVIDAGFVRSQTDFVCGAALAVSRKFVETIGPMDEDYFLYFEEIDWAMRARPRFKTGFAAGATIYHKEGGKIGRAHVCTPVTNAHLGCRLMLEKQKEQHHVN